jgi:hypothetical protein
VSVKKPLPDPDLTLVRKERVCLVCRAKFMSQWSGERVCQKCRSGGVWRAGNPWLTRQTLS